MRTSICFAMTVALAGLSVSAAAQQKPSAYPAKGQSEQQRGLDDTQCLAWSKKETGIDPAAVAAAPPPPAGPQGQRLRGAARGAAAGAVVGEVAHGDSNQGARTGAAMGVVAGGARARRSQAASAQQAQAAKANSMATYYSAYGACMQGRGYTVK